MSQFRASLMYLKPNEPTLILAPMEGVTDAPMRALQGTYGCFSYAVSEFIRVSIDVLPPKVFRSDAPEVQSGCLTPTGLPVQVQILGGDEERMAQSALNAIKAGAQGIDINFGCPAKTVNRNDGGASLLRYPARIESIVRAVRQAVPAEFPVSAKLRLGWEQIEDVEENAARAAQGGASWITLHARTRMQGYNPPVFYGPVRRMIEQLRVPVVANGDIFSIEDFRRCREETGAIHFMVGRGALANPYLTHQIAAELGLPAKGKRAHDWCELLLELERWFVHYNMHSDRHFVRRAKQWMRFASRHGSFEGFDSIKSIEERGEMLEAMSRFKLSG